MMKEVTRLLRCPQYHTPALGDVGSLFWAAGSQELSRRLLSIEGSVNSTGTFENSVLDLVCKQHKVLS